MKQTTLCLLVKGDEILLAMKKRGFGEGRWNGTGGKFDPENDKDIFDTAKRETKEEIGVEIINPEKEPYEEIDIISKNNLLVISPSAGDQHRTWPWEGNGEPRITIAFDIVPESKFPSAIDKMNHWIPI